MAASLPTAIREQEAQAGSRVYFPALDGLRFLAFLLVLIDHSRPLSGLLYLGSVLDTAATRINLFGWTGVEIFLVLSSYLIVTLLLKESDRTGTIGVGRFYKRRALRIWPLYYPYLLLSIFVYLPLQGVAIKSTVAHHLFPFGIFLGNYSYWYFSDSLSYAFAHLWTVCMEEQFYLVIPVLVFFGRQWSVGTVAGVMLGAELFTIGCRIYGIENVVPYPFVWSITVCRLDPLVIGTLLALLVRSGRAVPSNAMLAAAIILFVVATSFGQIGTNIHTSWMLTVVDLASACLILGATGSRIGLLVFANRPARFLGKISFGLYVYHEICLNLVWQWTDGLFAGHPARAWFAVLALTLIFDIAVSTLSYLLWERRFIVLKNRFETVRSRPA